MSEGAPTNYKLDHAPLAKDQIRAIAAIAKKDANLKKFANIIKKAAHLLETDPHGWGDPEYHSKSVEGVVCHAILRPVVFRYVVYEQVRSVVLLNVQLFADFA
jgi:hypothetical protein